MNCSGLGERGKRQQMVVDGVVCWGSGELGQAGRGRRCEVVSASNSDQSVLESIPSDGLYHMACGANYSISAGRDGVYVWGDGGEGQLGTGDITSRFGPEKLHLPFNTVTIAGIACGAVHSVIWTTDGLCYGFGSNSHSQLPLNYNFPHIDRQTVPVLLTAVQHNVVVQVACGSRHTVFLYECGSVATIGDNSYGQLGLGSRISCQVPQVITGLENVRLVSSGANHCIAVTEAGELYCWGYGTAIGYKHKDIVRPTKKLAHYTNIVQLAAGSTHSLALTENGNVYSWGSGVDGQLGHGEELTFLSKPAELTQSFECRISQIATSDSISAALTADGKLYLWGCCHHIHSNHGVGSLFRPLLIDLGSTKLCNVACGMAHVTAIAGTPLNSDGVLDESSRELTAEERELIDIPYMGGSTAGNSRATSASLPHANSPVSQHFQVQNTSMVRQTTLAEFYAPSPDVPPGTTVDTDTSEDMPTPMLPSTILLPGFKLPAIIDASRKGCEVAASGRSSRHFTSHSARWSERKSQPLKTGSLENESSDEEVENLLPLVTITKNGSSVALLNTPNQSHEMSTDCRRISHIFGKDSGSNSPVVPIITVKNKKLPSAESGVVKLKVTEPCSIVDERKRTLMNAGMWNPHRNSMFNSNVFYKDDKIAGGVNAKMIGFLDMSEIQLVDKPVKKTVVKPEPPDLHSHLYSKEMNLRNNRLNQKHVEGRDNSQSLLPFSFQKANRRAQISKQRPKLQSMVHPLDRSQTLLEKPHPLVRSQTQLEKPCGIYNLASESSKLNSPAKYSGSRRNIYHSVPVLLSNSNLLKKHLPRPLQRATPDFSRTMSKFDMSSNERNKLKLP